MNEMKSRILQLESEIIDMIKTLSKIESIYNSYNDRLSDDTDLRNAVMLTDIFVNYYTCIETIFFRISTFFENNLSKDRWHSDLLKKMRIKMNGIREKVITDQTFSILDEFRRFRHFKRYYYDYSYDREKLNYLQKKFDQLVSNIHNDINNFIEFLRSLND